VIDRGLDSPSVFDVNAILFSTNLFPVYAGESADALRWSSGNDMKEGHESGSENYSMAGR
jgi:hypothetical protein